MAIDVKKPSPEQMRAMLQYEIDRRAARGLNSLTLASGFYEVEPPIVLPKAFRLRGESERGVTIRAVSKPGGTAALIESKGLASFIAGPGAQWTVDGLPSEIVISDMTLDGGVDELFANTANWNGGDPAGMVGQGGGIDLYTNAPHIFDVTILNFAGTGIRFRRGHKPRIGPRTATDQQAARLRGIKIVSCFNGLHTGGADGIVTDVNVANCRDAGVIVAGAAQNFGTVHCFNMATGVKIIEGKHYFDILQSENCSTGVLVERGAGSGTQVANLRLFKNWAYGLLAERRVLVANASIDTSAADAVGIRLENASGSQVRGYMDAGSSAAAIEIDRCSNVRLDVTSWNNKKAGTFLKMSDLSNGKASRNDINCSCGNFATGVDFDVDGNGFHGRDNRIRLVANRVATPRVDGTPAPHASNEIVIVGGGGSGGNGGG